MITYKQTLYETRIKSDRWSASHDNAAEFSLSKLPRCFCWRARLIFIFISISYRSAQLTAQHSWPSSTTRMLALLTLLALGAFHSPHPHAEIVFTAGMPGIFPDSCSRLVLRRSPRATSGPAGGVSELLSGAADPAGYLATLRPHPRGCGTASTERGTRGLMGE